MKLYKAEAKDTQEISRFFSESVLHGSLDIRMQRPQDFFLQYQLQTDEFETYLLKNDEQKIEGVASFVYRDAHILGQVHKIGYCTDLRVSNSREAILAWTKYFLPLIEQGAKEHQVEFFFSVVAQNEGRAQNALLRPRSARRNIPRFYMLARFDVVMVIGRLPFAIKPLHTIDISPATENDLDALAYYLREKSRDRALSFVYTPELLRKQINTWPGLYPQSFLIARDKSKNIIGCVAPWDSFEVQNFVVQNYHGFTYSIKKLFDWTSIFKLTTRLPDPGEVLNFRYLTHFYADNPDIFYSLLYECYDRTPMSKILAYPHFAHDLISIPPRGFISSSSPMAIYTLLPPHKDLPDYLRVNRQELPPDIELALI